MWIGSDQRITRAILTGLCAIFFGANIAIVQSENWSFVDHPHPVFDELSTMEMDLLDAVAPNPIDTACARLLEAKFQIYLGRFPQFQELGSLKTQFSDWKTHLSAAPEAHGNHCLYIIPFGKMLAISRTGKKYDFYYCGTFSRKPKTSLNRELAEIVGELFVNAASGSPQAMIYLLAVNGSGRFIDLNPDAEYFFRKNINPEFEIDQIDRVVSHLLPLLSDERLAFLDNAVARHDLQAVLATTDPCPQRQSFAN